MRQNEVEMVFLESSWTHYTLALLHTHGLVLMRSKVLYMIFCGCFLKPPLCKETWARSHVELYRVTSIVVWSQDIACIAHAIYIFFVDYGSILTILQNQNEFFLASDFSDPNSS